MEPFYFISNTVVVPYMDTPNTFKTNKFYRRMVLRAHKAKKLKR